ncbi:unnamed protein product [Gongylonema pulchrum]|uniref:DUF2897 family protein n=1 Tax=Gongylonema pulchrum TaxID=637853 RepID=A0A183DMV2_9BILA|nr:unnamed protein product [Gongylonema pulchrum]
MFIMVIVLAILAIILVFECVIGLVRINRAKKKIAAAAASVEEEATTEGK